MLAVPYFEKALYELPEDQLTAEKVQQVAEEVAIKIQVRAISASTSRLMAGQVD
jgi:hypothetical protein